MGLFSDITRPIKDNINATDGIGVAIVRSKVGPILNANHQLIIDLMLRGAPLLLKQRNDR